MLNEHVIQQLHATTKDYGKLLYDRLIFLHSEINALAAALDANKIGYELLDQQTNERFEKIAIARLVDDQIALPSLHEKLGLDSVRIRLLASGQTILVSVPTPHDPPRIFMIRALGWYALKQKFLLGEVSHDYLWRDDDVLDSMTTLCVLEQSQNPIYCSGQGDAWVSDKVKSRLIEPSSGSFYQNIRGRNSVVTYWSVFLEPLLHISHWTIISMQPVSTVFAESTNFIRIYTIVMISTILIVVLLSFSAIRKSLLPLMQLMDGIRRISSGDFSKQVAVSSRDEFGILASSFNQMSLDLSIQIKSLRTMAEIDHLILHRFVINDIVKIVLQRVSPLLSCVELGILLLDDSENSDVRLYMSCDDDSDKMIVHTVTPTNREIEQLASSLDHVFFGDNGKRPSYLLPLGEVEAALSFVVLPILIAGQLVAALGMAYRREGAIPDADIIRAREFADRIAVGLSREAWEEQLYYQAHYDALTHLPNRLLVTDRLQQALARAKRQGIYTAVLFLDVDRFKTVNDSLGHRIGDRLLLEFSRRLLQATRQSDTIGRLGGDEFIVVLPDIPDNQKLLARTIIVAEKILMQLTEPFDLLGHTVRVTSSIGVALFPRDGDNVDDLLKNADSAMYHAKSKGRNNYEFYARELNATAVARLRMENQLHQALKSGQFELYYQPQVDIANDRIVAAECLLRWHHPEDGWISPADFIPVAEDTGLILPMGEWVLRTACKHAKSLHDNGFMLDIAVNLSALQFRQANLITTIRQALEHAGLEPHHLEIEVTETTTMHDLDESLAVLTQLHAMGVHIAIDDFGTGYSSLAYLKSFPVHSLKIDRSFIHNLDVNPSDKAITKSIIVLAQSLGLGIIAEGVETHEQLEYLRQQGCTKMQGYLCSRPVPLNELTALLQKAQRTPSAVWN